MLNKYIEKLQISPLKSTPKRIAIIEIFYKSNKFLTPEGVYKKLCKKFNACGLPSVYRNLESLAEHHILTKIHKFDNNRYYGLCNAEEGVHHHHIVCIRCGKIENVSGCELFKKKTIKGFKIIDHFLQLDGICIDCQ